MELIAALETPAAFSCVASSAFKVATLFLSAINLLSIAATCNNLRPLLYHENLKILIRGHFENMIPGICKTRLT